MPVKNKMFKTPLEKRIAGKFKEIDAKIKNSFSFIRQDVNKMDNSVELMKIHLEKRRKNDEYSRKEDSRIRAKFRKDVDEFTQKILQLHLALSQIKEIQKEVVVRADLARIEDNIKLAFREELAEFREEINGLKRQIREFEKRLKKREDGTVGKKEK